MESSVYEESDDSYLLVDTLLADRAAIATQRPVLAIELGSGSGVVIEAVREVAGSACVIAVDANPEACKQTLQRVGYSVSAVAADLMAAVEQRVRGAVDLLVFNPPYVPSGLEEVWRGSGPAGIEASYAGGVRGREVVDRVLPHVKDWLAPGGAFYLVAISDNAPGEIVAALCAAGLEAAVVARRQITLEALVVIRARRPR